LKKYCIDVSALFLYAKVKAISLRCEKKYHFIAHAKKTFVYLHSRELQMPLILTPAIPFSQAESE